jgi:hypothetical protein
MDVKVDIKADANRAMEHKESRRFSYIVLFTIIGLVLLFLFISREWVSQGKNVQSPLFTVTDPGKDSSKRRNDSPKIIITDNSKHLDIKDNHGRQNIKF